MAWYGEGIGELSPYTSPYAPVTDIIFAGSQVHPFFTQNRPGNPTFPFGFTPSMYTEKLPVEKPAPSPTLAVPAWVLPAAVLGGIIYLWKK